MSIDKLLDVLRLSTGKGKFFCLATIAAMWWVSATSVQREYGLDASKRVTRDEVVAAALMFTDEVLKHPPNYWFSVKKIENGHEEQTLVLRSTSGQTGFRHPMIHTLYSGINVVTVVLFTAALLLEFGSVVISPRSHNLVTKGFYVFLGVSIIACVIDLGLEIKTFGL